MIKKWLFYVNYTSIIVDKKEIITSVKKWTHILLTKSKCNMWRRQWHPTQVFLPGKSHGWSSLEGCSPWGRWGSATTERLHFHFSLSCIGEGNGNPLQCSCLENPRDRGTWRAAVYGVTQSRTRLEQLSSSSSSMVKRRYITGFLIEGWRWEAIINYINEKRMIMLKAAKTGQRFRIGIDESGNEGYLPISSVEKSYQKNE